MKYLYLALVAAVLSSCHSKYIEISGTVTGFTSGNFVIEDPSGHVKYSGNIEDAKFHYKQLIDTVGYYQLKIVQDGYKDNRRPGYDLYLEPGTYDITVSHDAVFQYPAIKSSSATQTELSQYYAIANDKTAGIAPTIEKYEDDIYGANASATPPNGEDTKLWDALAVRNKAMAAALLEFVSKYPQNHVAAHIMANFDYANDPGTYLPIYQKFSDEEKKTQDGTDEGDKLNGLANLVSGKAAQQIVGNTLSGKPFDPKSITKKVVLVEFWKADNDVSKSNHQNLLSDKFSPLKTSDFTVVSVSLDTDPAVWKKAVADGGLSWTQVSDLQGDNSPNIKNWQVTAIPTYYLIDGKNWTIIKANISFSELATDVDDYLHPPAK
jgi:hypothetical protein